MSASLNFQDLFEIDTNPAGTANWVRLGDGLSSVTPNNNEAVDTKAYLDDDGGQTSEITGFQHVIAFAGDRIKGDAAQDFIFGKLFTLGASRKTNVRSTEADGTVITGECTIASLVPGGGDANGTKACSFELRLNGKPTRTAPVAATALTATIAAGSASGTTKATATPGAGNSLGYLLAAQAVTANNREYVDNYTAYTSGSDIPAAAGQFLAVYELDAYFHVVKFVCQELAAGDIAV